MVATLRGTAGHDIIEIPISYNPRTYAEGKKIKARDGLRAMVTMLRDRLGMTPVLKPDQAGVKRIVGDAL